MSNDAPTADQSNAAPAADTTNAPAATPAGQAPPPAVAAPAQPAADAKPADQPPADAKKADDAPQGAPEAYADFTAPEGTKFNDAVMGDFKSLAKQHNLSQEAAQAFVDLGAKQATGQVEALRNSIIEAQAKWAVDTKADKEYGGDKFDENMALGRKVRETFGTPELDKLLDETGLGNHPEVNRFFIRFGKAISEDKLVPGGKKPDDARSAQGFYSNSNMNP